jgi:hypothetical protein
VTVLDLPHADPTRDRWGRPVIDGRTYTRVSTLAKVLDDTRALMDWNARITAIGVARSEDLIAGIATTDPDDKKTLNALVGQAKERAQSTAKATIGTAIHSATELLDRGQDLNGLPDKVRVDAEAYQDTMRMCGLTPLAAEMFVVCDEVNAAGTFDRLIQGPNRCLIGDIKTSGNPDTHKYAALSWALQISVYAHSRPWIPGRGIVDWTDIGLPTPDLERGLVIHIVQGTGQVKLHSVDLKAGWVAAQIADEVLAIRKYPNITQQIPTPGKAQP